VAPTSILQPSLFAILSLDAWSICFCRAPLYPPLAHAWQSCCHKLCFPATTSEDDLVEILRTRCNGHFETCNTRYVIGHIAGGSRHAAFLWLTVPILVNYLRFKSFFEDEGVNELLDVGGEVKW
jgi:hypothetical protein